ncbi:MAG: hypothetical protein XD84_1919 [Desulfotomaculum sp. 46_80]|nr:MAG: hypothetical protein XD84_1919 [Desulfotomaculum sp. 46_80]
MVPMKNILAVSWRKHHVPLVFEVFAGVAELADARDLKSLEGYPSYRFKSGLRHQRYPYLYLILKQLGYRRKQ